MNTIILVGDPCTGKSTVLKRLADDGFHTAPEEGWARIPSHIEADKAAANRWFCDYFFERDSGALARHRADLERADRPIIFERILHYQYPLGAAQYKNGKVDREEFDANNAYLDALAARLDFGEMKTIQFLGDYHVIHERLARRGIYKTEAQFPYWDLVRAETRAYFEPLGDFYTIDISGASEDETYKIVAKIIQSDI